MRGPKNSEGPRSPLHTMVVVSGIMIKVLLFGSSLLSCLIRFPWVEGESGGVWNND